MQGELGGPFDFIGDIVSAPVDAVKWVAGGIKDVTCGIATSGVGRLASTGAMASGNPYGIAAGAAGMFAANMCASGDSGAPPPTPAPGGSAPTSMFFANQVVDRYRPPSTTSIPPATTPPTTATIAAFVPKKGHYRVAVKAGVSGLGSPLGQGYREVGTSTTPPAGAQLVPLVQYEKMVKRPWYRRWQTYAIAGGVVAAGGVGLVVLRR